MVMHETSRSRSSAASESGFAMIMALVVVLVLWLLTLALANLAVSEYSTAAGMERSNQAFLAAEAGVERAIADLEGDPDWNDGLGADARVTTSWTLKYTNVPLAGSQFNVWLRHPGPTNSASMEIRSIGEASGAARTVEYAVETQTDNDIVLYSVSNLSSCAIPGGGSLQFHGSAYIEADMCLKGGSQAGFYNDRYVLSSQAPNYLNHLYVNGNLDTSTGNPSIGTSAQPYWWLHVGGSIVGPSNKIYTVNYDNAVPPPFYPAVVEDLVKPAFDAPNPADPLAPCHPPSTLPCRRGNAVVQDPGSPPTMHLVICRYPGNDTAPWTADVASADLILEGSGAYDGNTFYLPKAEGWTGTCTSGSPSTVRNSQSYMLFWDARLVPPSVNSDPGCSNCTNMVYVTQDPAAPDLQIYVPGGVFLRRDVRYEGKGTIVVANHPQATVYSGLLPQAACALDLNISAPGDPACTGAPSSGHWIRTRVSPCLSNPGTDNPYSTYVTAPAGVNPDLAVFLVNGSAYSNLNANACDQEMDAVMIVGDRNATGTSICGSGACYSIQKKLQWYGVLMTRSMGLGQVPDFWQMPDLRLNLPASVQNLFQSGQQILVIRRWREIF